MTAAETDVIDVTGASHVSAHCLEIAFSDGTRQIVDFGPFLRASQHPDIRSYLDPEKFIRFTVEDGMLHWNDFDLVFPVTDLHCGRIAGA
jgi:Protein of unknown function (DUF2442)